MPSDTERIKLAEPATTTPLATAGFPRFPPSERERKEPSCHGHAPFSAKHITTSHALLLPRSLTGRPGMNTAHCCVASHQVYLPDFERKARVGVRAQPARNHWKKRQRHIKSSSYTLRKGAVLLLLQSCLPWPTPPPPSIWAGLLPCLIKGVITSDHRLSQPILIEHTRTLLPTGGTIGPCLCYHFPQPSLPQQGSKCTETGREQPLTETLLPAFNTHLRIAVQPTHNKGFGNQHVTSRFCYIGDFGTAQPPLLIKCSSRLTLLAFGSEQSA